jgi:hypothetical protein
MLQVNPIPHKMLRHIKYIITCLVHILEHVGASQSIRNSHNLLETRGKDSATAVGWIGDTVRVTTACWQVPIILQQP